MIDHRGREVTDAAGVTQAVLDAGMSPKVVDLVTVRPGRKRGVQGWRGRGVVGYGELGFGVGAGVRHW